MTNQDILLKFVDLGGQLTEQSKENVEAAKNAFNYGSIEDAAKFSATAKAYSDSAEKTFILVRELMNN